MPTFSVPILRDEDYTVYQVPSDRIDADAVDLIRGHELQQMKVDQLVRRLQQRLLARSAHKGKFLGLRAEASGALVAADPALLTMGNNYSLVIEHLDDTLSELLEHLSRKVQTLNARHHTLLSRTVMDRLSRHLAWTSDAIEGSTLREEDAHRFDFQEAEKHPELLNDDEGEYVRHWQTIQTLLLPLVNAEQQRLDVGAALPAGCFKYTRERVRPISHCASDY